MLLIISLVFEDRVVGCMSLDRGGLVANTVALERTEGEISSLRGKRWRRARDLGASVQRRSDDFASVSCF
jgi:hypothetical protein